MEKINKIKSLFKKLIKLINYTEKETARTQINNIVNEREDTNTDHMNTKR